jgi:hypothetical protein
MAGKIIHPIDSASIWAARLEWLADGFSPASECRCSQVLQLPPALRAFPGERVISLCMEPAGRKSLEAILGAAPLRRFRAERARRSLREFARTPGSSSNQLLEHFQASASSGSLRRSSKVVSLRSFRRHLESVAGHQRRSFSLLDLGGTSRYQLRLSDASFALKGRKNDNPS